MLPISPSADSATSLPGSHPSRPVISSASSGENSSRTIASMSPKTGSTTPVTTASAGPAASTASASGSATAFGTETSIARPSSPERAVAALPEPMLASSRSASSWRSEYLVTSGSPLGSGHDWRPVAACLGQGVAVDDQGDVAVREDCPSGEGGLAGELGGKRSGHELALPDQADDGEREAAVGAADDDGMVCAVDARVAERLGEIEEGQHAVALDEHAPAGHRAHDARV